MDDGDNEDVTGADEVDDAIALVYQFAYVIAAFRLGNG